MEISEEKKKKKSVERKIVPRINERIHSSKKKRKESLDKYGKPLTNISRVNINTSKKKPPKERLENTSRLEISAERKKKKRIERKPESRKHRRYSSSKKRKLSVDSEGRPLPNTKRLNIDTSKKKEPKERLENRARLEISAERKKKKSIEKKPESRKHRRYSSNKKKKLSVDSKGNPLPNTSRKNIDTSKKKAPKERLVNTSRMEISAEIKKKKSIDKKLQSRKHSIITSPKKRKVSLDKEGKPLTNVSRLRVGIERGEVKYAQIEDFDKYEDKSHQRHQVFATESKYNKSITKYTTMKTPIKTKENGKEKTGTVKHQRNNTQIVQLPIKKPTEAGQAFFSNKYKYEKITKEDKEKQAAKDLLTKKTQQTSGTTYSTNLKYGISTSRLNTAATNTSDKQTKRFDKGFNMPKTDLFGKKDKAPAQAQISRNYSYNKDLITKKNNLNTNVKEKTKETIKPKGKTLSENKKLDFSKYYKVCKTEKKQQTTQYQKPIDKINGKDVYEYIPIPQVNKYPKTAQKSSNGKQKEYSIDVNKYTGLFDKLNNKYQVTEASEETKSSENKRNRSNIPNNKFSFSPNTMGFFKLQFVTTKQVVQKFWSSIDNGDLSISMFDPQRNSSKLSVYLSPEKNRMSKISTSIDTTEYTKYRNSENINKKINFSYSEVNIGSIRRSVKA